MAKELWSSPSLLDEFVKVFKNTTWYERLVLPSGAVRQIPHDRPIVSTDSSGTLILNKGYIGDASGFDCRYCIPRSSTTDFIEDMRKSGYTEKQIQEYKVREDYPTLNVYHGMYPTIADFLGMFGLGQQYGKRNILGYKDVFSRRTSDGSYNLTSVAFNIGKGPYPMRLPTSDSVSEDYQKRHPYSINWSEGSLLRDEDMNRVLVCKDKETDFVWADLYNPTRNFGTAFYDGPNMNDTEMFLTTTLPTNRTDFAEPVASFDGNGRTYMFNHYLTYVIYNKTTKAHHFIPKPLCKEGSMVVKLSKYNDIYTNQDHLSAYVEILRTQEFDFSTEGAGGINRGRVFRVNTPPQIVALKKGVKYYLYVEYSNGCCGKVYDEELYHDNRRIGYVEASFISFTRTDRELKWPSTLR